MTLSRLFLASFLLLVGCVTTAICQIDIDVRAPKTVNKLKTQIFVQVPSGSKIESVTILDSSLTKVGSSNFSAVSDSAFIEIELKKNNENVFQVFYAEKDKEQVYLKSLIIMRAGVPETASTPDTAGDSAPRDRGAVNQGQGAQQKTPLIESPIIVAEPGYNLPLTADKIPADAINIKVQLEGGKSKNENNFDVKKEGEKISPMNIPLSLVGDKNKPTVNKLTIQFIGKDGKTIGDPIRSDIICDGCNEEKDFFRSVNTRAVVGLEQVGASSAVSETHPFLDLFFNVPIGRGQKDKDGNRYSPRFSLWTDFRFSASPVQNLGGLSAFSTNALAPIFTGGAEVGAANNIVQSFSITGGGEVRLIGGYPLFPLFSRAKSSLSFIAGGGVTNPLSSQKGAQIFKIPKLANGAVTPEFGNFFTGLDFTGKTNIAFVTPERDRFYRRWFFGTRVRAHFFKNETTPLAAPAAMLDVTFGQDESITGDLSGKVMKVDAFIPLPMKDYDYVYFFGGVNMRLTRKINNSAPPFFLEPAQTLNLTGTDTVIVPLDSPVFNGGNSLPFFRVNRDTFNFGIGVDLYRLFKKGSETEAATPAKPK